MLDLDIVRRHFPALDPDMESGRWVLFDNAGGSVPLGSVIDEIAAYMRAYGVQLGASYALSAEAGEKVAAGHRAMERFIGAAPGEVVLGPSTTVNLTHLARSLRPLWQSGDEVIVTDLDHEANIGPWRALEATGIVLKEWTLRPETADLHLEDLDDLLSEKTRLVAMTHCSNVVGRIHDVPAVASRVHDAGALLCVDGVAFAPHRQVDVGALGADFYVFSTYKTYGPHQSVLWGRKELWREAVGQSHFFIGEDQVPYKMEPGGPNHELAASLPAIPAYFEGLAAAHGVDSTAAVFERVAEHEERLSDKLLEFLTGRRGVRVIGPSSGAREIRVPTVAFAVEGRDADTIPPRVDEHRVAIRWGDFYARRAIERLGLSDRGGVVRVSMVHYNTEAELDRLLEALDAVL